jgi:simple sugar transport system ATP-binding protein
MAKSNEENEVPLVRMEKIMMHFGSVVALDGVDFDVRHAEVMALLGDNGAGKSTLIKILTGVHQLTSGTIYFDGNAVVINSPQDSRALGIETVYQDLALVNAMSIGRNFYLGREPVRKVGPFPWLDMHKIAKQTRDSLADVGIQIRSAGDKVGKLSGGERQSIAIGRAVHFGVKLLILDEPTSALSVGEARKVLDYTRIAKARGMSVIFITHNVHHVMEVADRYTIIRHGTKVGTYGRDEINYDELSDLISGAREK